MSISGWGRIGAAVSVLWLLGTGLYAFLWRADAFKAAEAIAFSYGEICLRSAKGLDEGLRCASEEVRLRESLEPFNRSDVIAMALRWLVVAWIAWLAVYLLDVVWRRIGAIWH
jgi:hypothetical protein